jgi:dihydropteroate synthase
VLSLAERPLIMGILNVTPDSFSDGGMHESVEAAFCRAHRLLEDGADIVDVGGESTRPSAAPVGVEEELRRVIPVIRRLACDPGVVISVDTRKAEVARAALEAGARIINDVTALTGDPAMPAAAAEFGAGVVLMHMAGTPLTMQQSPVYHDVVEEVGSYLARRVEDLVGSAKLDPRCLTVDPGIGFGKTLEHNLQLLAGLSALREKVGRPLVVGLSRKSFLGKITGRAVNERLAGSLAGLVYCVLRGVRVVRVHDVRETADAVRVAMAICRAEGNT